MSRLLAEGTDLDDKEAVDDAVRAYNAEQLVSDSSNRDGPTLMLLE
jgi:hypothetical protein